MPKRIWLWTGLLIVALVAAFVAVTIAVPEPEVVLNPPQPEPPPDPQELSDRLLADLTALAARRRAPAVAAEGYGSWNSVTPSRAEISFTYRVQIDPGYTVPAGDPTVLFPGFEAYDCGIAGTCYRVTPALTANICSDPELRGLIDRGARVVVIFHNRSVTPLGSVILRAQECAAQ